ncbi:MAG TPA: ethanolamine utilization protein EutJ [Symbiobacteriaceae bacterium]|nr:ethanolamine utilization protein EutJ [Symbiobacteriaceae bacterium]
MAAVLEVANRRLDTLWGLLEAGETPVAPNLPLRVGVDLGTANIVVAVADEKGEPLAGALQPARVVKDGLVVDYVGAIAIIRRLVAEVERRIGRQLTHAACAIPPGTGKGAERVTANVVQSADLEVTAVVDEPTAAATFLGIRDGAVIDVGGGTTGISVLKRGKVVYTADEATGGTHFTLVVAGRFGVSFAEAEALKLGGLPARDLFPVVMPVVEKVASIVQRHLQICPAKQAYLVGGAVALPGMADVMARYLGIPVHVPAHPLLVTPMGIAMAGVQGGEAR